MKKEKVNRLGAKNLDYQMSFSFKLIEPNK